MNSFLSLSLFSSLPVCLSLASSSVIAYRTAWAFCFYPAITVAVFLDFLARAPGHDPRKFAWVIITLARDE